MIFKCKVSAVVLLVIFVCLSCNDNLDEVYQATDKIVRSKLIKSIIVDSDDMESPKTYKFNYTEDNYLESFTDGNSGSVKMKYNKVDGSLVNFEEVAAKIFYVDFLFSAAYSGDYKGGEVFVKESDEEVGNPTVIKMILTEEDGTSKNSDIEISYDLSPNIYRPYLVAGGIVDAADKRSPLEGRGTYFTSKFLPTNNPSILTYKNNSGDIEHYYSIQYAYDNKQRVTTVEIMHFDVTTGGSPEFTTVLYSYMDSAVK